MITRFYVDNYKCLVNLGYEPTQFELIVGANGSGKSTVFEALGKLQRFILGDVKAEELFSAKDLTRWQSRPVQNFELQITAEEDVYDYLLELRYDVNLGSVVVQEEMLKFNGSVLTAFERRLVPLEENGGIGGYWEGQIWVHERVGLEEITWNTNNRSTLAAFEPRDTPQTHVFRRLVNSIFLIKLAPSRMTSYTNAEIFRPKADFSNFAWWYRRLIGEKPGAIAKLYRSLEEVIEGFEEMFFVAQGEFARELKVRIQVEPDAYGRFTVNTFDFEELSDGQRALIVLYTLVFCALEEGVTLLIDEPENFVSSRELQPWLMLLQERIEDFGGQAILISHHPEFINALAPQDAIQFRRKNGGPVTIRPFETARFEGLTPAEIVARGWDNE